MGVRSSHGAFRAVFEPGRDAVTSAERPGQLLEVVVGDAPDAWVAAGFAVRDGAFDVGGVTIRLAGDAGERGIRGWRLRDVGDSIDGLAAIDAGPSAEPIPHPNRTVAIDHVVAGSDDLDRTTAALAVHGIDLRRRREFDLEGVARQQRFFWLGSVILELIGRATPGPPKRGAASFWGLAFVVDDIDETCRVLGDATSSHRTAIQPGRRISTLDGDGLGVSLKVAFMSPHPGSG